MPTLHNLIDFKKFLTSFHTCVLNDTYEYIFVKTRSFQNKIILKQTCSVFIMTHIAIQTDRGSVNPPSNGGHLTRHGCNGIHGKIKIPNNL